ncbi:hypothetical protein QE152_g37459 [Popillia japonica]|uniref:Uncharacterized protein n=1 Tax=Popillia japonica TaxID=7064 RepID=A0AAW1I9I9_POPJA
MEDDLANLFLSKLTPDSVIPEITITPNSVSNHIILKPFREVLSKLTPDSVIPEITITPNSVSNHIILKPFREVEFSRVLAQLSRK